LLPGCQGAAGRTARAVILCLGLFGVAQPLHADPAAGREAFEKGDYARAMSEWQSSADHGDPDAQLGLGQLYEFGAGGLPQSYERAEYWYRKAAKQGTTEALYRMALIYAAGGDDFPANLVDAYKWAVSAVSSKGVWGSAAADLLAELQKVTTTEQQKTGEQRAESWRQARAPRKETPPAVDSTIAASSPTIPSLKPIAGGCPGWPFPTLPCTEKFPALPGASAPLAPAGPREPRPPAQASLAPHAPAVPEQRPPPQAAVAPQPPPAREPSRPPLDQLNDELNRIDCAVLRAQMDPQGVTVVSGTVPDSDQRGKLVQLASRLFPERRPELRVEVVPPPICRSLAELDAMAVGGILTKGGLGLKLADNASELRESDAIKVELRGPGYAADLRIDYFSLDGRVLHMWPNSADPKPRIGAGAERVFQDSGGGKTWNAGGPPFGTELITAIATPITIDVGSRPLVEPAADYLRDLKRSLARSGSGPGTPNTLATLLVKTRGR
jgi:hypothetical protein